MGRSCEDTEPLAVASEGENVMDVRVMMVQNRLR